MQEQYAVCHLQCGNGSDSGLSFHIMRKGAKGNVYVPEDADKIHTHLNRDLVKIPEGVKNRIKTIRFCLYNAELQRKAGKNQFNAGRLSGHEFINIVFSTAGQVNETQTVSLGVAMEQSMGGLVQAYVGIGGGGVTFHSYWSDKEKTAYERKH